MYGTQLSTLQLFIRSKLEIKTGIKEMLSFVILHNFFVLGDRMTTVKGLS
jgi:hypothetical protein